MRVSHFLLGILICEQVQFLLYDRFLVLSLLAPEELLHLKNGIVVYCI